MKKILNRNGLTLIEVLAVIIIIILIFSIIYGIQFNSNNQYKMQIEKNEQLNDISYALKVITKDFRKSGLPPRFIDNTIIIGDEEYKFDTLSKSVTRNGDILVNNIIKLDIYPLSTNKYKIFIKNDDEEINTEIVIRGVNE